MLNKNQKIKVIISAVSLETLLEAKNAIKNFDEQNIVQIHSIRGCRINDTTEFTSNNPIYLIYGGTKA